MKKFIYIAVIFGLILLAVAAFKIFFYSATPVGNTASGNNSAFHLPVVSEQSQGNMIVLPEPVIDGTVSLERALSLRRSIRSYKNQALKLSELSQLLWAAQGVTNARGFRTAPSAGATFPLELFVMVNNVEGLRKGIYHYQIGDHDLKMIDQRELEDELVKASLGQNMIRDAGATIIFAAIFERTTNHYGERGIRYIHNEVGHVSQNIHLQAAALNLGTVVIGAFRDEQVEDLLNLGEEFRVLYIMPVGKI